MENEMKRGTMLGAAAGLVAGVSLTTLALAAPSYAFLGGGSSVTTPAAGSVAAPAAAQLVAPLAGQSTRWGTVPNLADLVEKVSPSVVKIEVRASNPNKFSRGDGDNPLAGTPFEDFFRGLPQQGLGQGEQRDMRGSGSGFVI